MDPDDTLQRSRTNTVRPRAPRPVPPGVEYHRVLAGDKCRIGRGTLAIALVVGGMFVFAYRLAEAAALALVTWRTGGVETAVVLHAVLNTATFLAATALHADIGALVTDRSAGVGGPILLVPSVTIAAIAAVVWWRTRHSGPALTPAHTRSAASR